MIAKLLQILTFIFVVALIVVWINGKAQGISFMESAGEITGGAVNGVGHFLHGFGIGVKGAPTP